MSLIRQYSTLILLFAITFVSRAENRTDSLLLAMNSPENDSLAFEARLLYIQEFRHNYTQISNYVFEGIRLSKEKHDFYFLGQFYSAAGIMYAYVGNNDSSLTCFSTSLNYRTYLKDTLGIGAAKLGMSNIYKNMGDYSSAITYGLEAEEAFKQVGNHAGLAKTYNSVGLIFKQQKDYEKALEYYQKGLIEADLSNDLPMFMGLYSNIGAAYQELFEFDSAMIYHKKALELRTGAGDLMGVGISYGNIGHIFVNLAQYDSALFYTEKARAYFEQCGYSVGILQCHISMGQTSQFMKNPSRAIYHFKLAEKIAEDGNFLPELLNISDGLAQAYESLGKYQESTHYLKQKAMLKDSLFSNEKTRDLQKQEIEFEYAQKKLADSLLILEKEKIAALETEKQRQINEEQSAAFRFYIIAGVFVLILILLIVLILYRNNQRHREFNAIIATQKNIVEEKNKEITDSINYAKRIQAAYLPPTTVLNHYFPESFLLFQPKDIVSGDFYWFYAPKNPDGTISDEVFVAVADCTGHGVPGAIMSVICCNALNEAIITSGILETGKILDEVRNTVIRNLKSRKNQDQKDGMDIALCRINQKNGEVEFSGANNPLWIVGKNGEFAELKPDKQPVGFFVHQKPFSSATVTLQTGDTLYLFSDGYADQFGGPKGKKFKYASLKNILLGLRDKSSSQKREQLLQEFNRWRNFGQVHYEQVDDVCIIGITRS